MKVLFVCEGNTCRSPMAQIIFSNLAKKHKRTDINVKSAGTWAEDGSGMIDLTAAALIECGEELPDVPFKTTRFTMEMQSQFDHVFDLRSSPDPCGYNLDAYIVVCKHLQKELGTLYDKICKT